MWVFLKIRVTAAIILCAAVLGVTLTGASAADTVTEDHVFTTDDGTEIQTTLTGAAPLEARPTIIEFSPYGRDSETFVPDEDYNRLLVQIRGTGDSKGSFDALGPDSQADVPEVLEWACQQPWSDGNLGIHGFSASAIMIYNSLHQELPCVKTMTLRSGTFELYRDLLVPGGVTNIVPGAAVLATISGPILLQGSDRMSDPASWFDAIGGMFYTGMNAGLLHPTLDTFWQKRGFRGDVNHLPIMMLNGIFDVESRGAFQAYQELRDDGAHLVLAGGHDGFPDGTDNGQADMQAWYDHYLRGADNGITEKPPVRLTLSDGDRQDMIDGQYLHRDAKDWPVPGTDWESLNLDATRSGAAQTVNDGTLTLGEPNEEGKDTYVPAPTSPLVVDVPTTSLLESGGLDMLTSAIPQLTDMDGLSGLPGLSYTSEPMAEDVIAAGPPTLDVRFSTMSAESPIWAVVSDVHPDGSAHPLTVGRLMSSFPDVIEEKSLKDENGTIVQPYGDFSEKSLGTGNSLSPQLYQVELWPIANRFKQGHRVRLDIVGASLFSLPSPGLANTVEVGGDSGSRLLFPVLPESDLDQALGADLEPQPEPGEKEPEPDPGEKEPYPEPGQTEPEPDPGEKSGPHTKPDDPGQFDDSSADRTHGQSETAQARDTFLPSTGASRMISVLMFAGVCAIVAGVRLSRKPAGSTKPPRKGA